MATKIKLRQLENSATIGSIISTDGSNIQTFVAPSSGVNHLWGFETGGAGTLPVLLGTNLSYDAPTNTLNATAGAGGYSEIQEESGALTARTKLAFLGSAFTAADDAGNSRTTVSAATFLNTLATAGVVGLAGSDVSGTLPVGKGGTGATTLTGLLQGNGTSAVTAVTNPTQVGQVLRATGTTTYAWGALDLADTDAVVGVLDEVNGGTGQSTITTGDLLQGTASNTLGKLPSVATGNALISGGVTTASSWGKIGLTTHVSGILPIANGGTGSGTQNFVDLTNVQSIGGAKTFTSNITITATPSANTDAATVGWVLNNVAGFKSGSVRVATTGILTATAQTSATITLGGTTLTIDGQTMANGEAVLVKDSVTGGSGGTFNNGVYTVSGIGSSVLLTRVAWMDTAAEIDGVYVLVQDGTSNVGTLWFTVSEVTTLGTDAISFTQISTSGTIGGSIATNQIGYGSGTNTLTGTGIFYLNGTTMGLGTASPNASSRVHIKGAGNTSATNALLIHSSTDAERFAVRDDGLVTINSGITLTTGAITYIGGTNNIITSSVAAADGFEIKNGGGGIKISASSGTSAATHNFITLTSGLAGVNSSTGINQGVGIITGTFSPSGAGTNTYMALQVTPTINQTTHTGVTRGIHINPTLTAAADFRALEITSGASHYALWSTQGKVRFDFGTPAVGDLLTRDTGGEQVRIAAGTAGHVLTSNGAGTKPTWQAAAGGVTVTRAYLTSSTSSVIDLDSGTAVQDVDGANVTFTTSGIPVDKIFVVRNGILQSRTGTGPTRDYTLDTSSGVLTLAVALSADEDLVVYKIV